MERLLPYLDKGRYERYLQNYTLNYRRICIWTPNLCHFAGVALEYAPGWSSGERLLSLRGHLYWFLSMNIKRELTCFTSFCEGGNSSQPGFSYSQCAAPFKSQFLSSASSLPQALHWPSHRPELPHKRCFLASSFHCLWFSALGFSFLGNNKTAEQAWDPSLKWDMGALDRWSLSPLHFLLLSHGIWWPHDQQFLFLFLPLRLMNSVRTKLKL